MTRRAVQLRLTRPAKKVRVGRMTQRQTNLLGMLRWDGDSAVGRMCSADRLGELCGYAYPRAALDRLVARGLAEKVRPGVYRARVIRERSL